METRLGNYIHEYSVRNKLDEDIPVYSVTNSQGFCKDYFGKEVASKNKTSYKIVPKGYFVYNPSRINVGSVDWQRNEERVIVSPLYNVFYVDSEINHQYLFYFLKSNFALQNIKAVATGSVRDNLKFEMLKEFQIKLLPLEEQNEIVEKLDLITKIIEEYKTELYKYDELIKARFIEMFGDPVSNSKHLPLKTLPQLGTFGRGVSKYRPRNAPELLNGPYPLIQTGDIANSELYIKNYNNTYSEVGLKQSKMWDKGTLCITIAANIAKTAILQFDACFPDSVVGFNGNNLTNNIFVHYWFSFFQEILENQAPESAQKNINLKILSELQIITPDIIEQNQFADFVRQVDKSRFVELLQDHGIFDLGLNTDEMDTYYNEFLEQVQDQKQEVIDNQEIILTLQDTSLLNVFHEKTSEAIQNELEKEISEMFNGIEGEDASKLYDSLHNQIQYA